MLTINKLIPQGRGLAGALLRRAPAVTLDWDLRARSRFDATDSEGRALGVFLPRGSVVRGGDVLVAEDGSLVRVLAAPQPVLEVRPCPQHGSAFDLTRAAYHLGNRHVSIELRPDHLKIEPDPVLAELLRAMHLTVTENEAAFEPEGGAYAAHAARAGHGHGHAHGPAPGHDHGHDHAHDHAHGRGHDHAHRHDPPGAHDPRHDPGRDHAAAQPQQAGRDRGHDPGHDHDHDHAHGRGHGKGHGHHGH